MVRVHRKGSPLGSQHAPTRDSNNCRRYSSSAPQIAQLCYRILPVLDLRCLNARCIRPVAAETSSLSCQAPYASHLLDPRLPVASVTEQVDDLQLMEEYGAVICSIVSEIDGLSAGELAILSIYVVEPGQSTDKLLAALR